MGALPLWSNILDSDSQNASPTSRSESTSRQRTLVKDPFSSLPRSVPRCDVTKEAGVAAAVDAAVARHGRLDVMFNNAGVIGERGPIDQARAEDFDFALEVNLRSVFLGTKHAARVMKERRTGCILNTASVVAVTGGRGPHG